MREKVTSLWRVECNVFGSKFECVWMENEDDNNGVQVGLKNGGYHNFFVLQYLILYLYVNKI